MRAPGKLSTTVVLVVSAACTLPGPSRAKDGRDVEGVEERADGAPLTLSLDASLNGWLDRERLRRTIAKELIAPVLFTPDAAGGTIFARRVRSRLVVSFDGPDGRHTGRSIDEPMDAERAAMEVARLAVTAASNRESKRIVQGSQSEPAHESCGGYESAAVAERPAHAAEDKSSVAQAFPVALSVELQQYSPSDREWLRVAIERQLEVPVVSDQKAAGGAILVRRVRSRLVVSFDGPDGRHVGCSTQEPADNEHAAIVIALLAVRAALDRDLLLIR